MSDKKQENKIPAGAASAATPLYELARYSGFSDTQPVDPRESWDTWAEFVKVRGWEAGVNDGSPLIYWVWRRPPAERVDEYEEEDAAAIVEDNPELAKEALLLYYFQSEYETTGMELVCLRIYVTKQDEPEIRKFIAKHFQKPFE